MTTTTFSDRVRLARDALARNADNSFVYVASAYSHNETRVRHARAQRAARAAGGLALAGLMAYSPIAHGVALEDAEGGLEGLGHSDWMALCAPMLAASRVVYVVAPAEGDELANAMSAGLQAEIATAESDGWPVVYGSAQVSAASMAADAVRIKQALLDAWGVEA